MAGRFVFQKLASGMSSLTSRLSPHASASARATALVTPRVSEAGIRTLSDVLQGAAVRPGMAVSNNCAIHAYAARYHSTFPCSSAAAKTGWSTTGLLPSIINQKKSAFVDSVGGVKRTFSSGASNKLEHFLKAKLADWRARFAAWYGPTDLEGADDLAKFVRNAMLLCAFTTAALFAPLPSDQLKSDNMALIAHHGPNCKCFSGPSES